MDSADSDVAELQRALLDVRQTELDSLQTELAEAGGIRELLRARYPRLANWTTTSGQNTEFSEAGIAELTLTYLGMVEARLAQCASCPPEGGTCRDDAATLRRGRLPVIDGDGRLRATARCERWVNYAVARRLLGSGVERRLAFEAAAPVSDGAIDPGARAALRAFARAVLEQSDGWTIVSGPPASGKTLLAARTMAAIFRRDWRRVVRCYTLAPIQRELFTYFKKRDTYPLASFLEAPAAVFDGCNLAGAPEPIRIEVLQALRERWGTQRPTLITTTDDATALATLIGGTHAAETIAACRLPA